MAKLSITDAARVTGGGVPVASVQKTSIRASLGKAVEQNERLRPRRFPAVIVKFLAVRNYALPHKELWGVCENDPSTRHGESAAPSS